jgi:glycerol uptake facilitator-like aquaporin
LKLRQRLAAEFLGTAFLLAAVVGSGIMGERLADGNLAVALLANSIATGGALVALILTFGGISGAHFNPAVTLAAVLTDELGRLDAALYVSVQVLGAFAGVAAAHTMFAESIFTVSEHARSGGSQWWSEAVATFGLIATISSCGRTRPATVPFAVAAYIVAAYWFTASTSFANPAVTLARGATNTFSGIAPADIFAFIFAQLAATPCAVYAMRWLLRRPV